jgi:hypothetical protein
LPFYLLFLLGLVGTVALLARLWACTTNNAGTTIISPDSNGVLAIIVGGWTDTHISPIAAIQSTKLIQRPVYPYFQKLATAVVSDTAFFQIYGATGSIVAVVAQVTGVKSTGGDSVVIDLQKSTGGGAFATVLSATITLNSSSTILVQQFATVLTTGAQNFVVGDVFKLIVTASGSSTQGLVVSVVRTETPQ